MPRVALLPVHVSLQSLTDGYCKGIHTCPWPQSVSFYYISWRFLLHALNICTLVALYKYCFGVNYFGVGRLVYNSTFEAFSGLNYLQSPCVSGSHSFLVWMYTFRSFKKSNCFFDYSNHLSFFPENFNSFCHFNIKLRGLFWLNFHPLTFFIWL